MSRRVYSRQYGRVWKYTPGKPRKVKADFICRDCLVNTKDLGEYYMVHDHLWDSVMRTGSQKRSLLCVGCLETRLGRELTAEDFTEFPINTTMRLPGSSERLLNRWDRSEP